MELQRDGGDAWTRRARFPHFLNESFVVLCRPRFSRRIPSFVLPWGQHASYISPPILTHTPSPPFVSLSSVLTGFSVTMATHVCLLRLLPALTSCPVSLDHSPPGIPLCLCAAGCLCVPLACLLLLTLCLFVCLLSVSAWLSCLAVCQHQSLSCVCFLSHKFFLFINHSLFSLQLTGCLSGHWAVPPLIPLLFLLC